MVRKETPKLGEDKKHSSNNFSQYLENTLIKSIIAPTNPDAKVTPDSSSIPNIKSSSRKRNSKSVSNIEEVMR